MHNNLDYKWRQSYNSGKKTNMHCSQHVLNKIRRALFQNSHLTAYLPFIGESMTDKRLRIWGDATSCKELKEEVKIISRRMSLNAYDPCGNWLLVWYFLVFWAIMYYFSQTGIVLTYGLQAWQDERASPTILFLNILFLLILTLDIWVQLSTGYLHRGVVIQQRSRVVDRYIHYYIFLDILLVAAIMGSLIECNYNWNFAKMIVGTKFIRMFEFDQFYLRRLARERNLRALYVISKQIVTLFVLSHLSGLIFYLIDLGLTQDTICIENNSLCWLYSATAYSPILNYHWQIQYFYTLYWGVNTITTISYGDIAPNNPYETPYALFMMCFGFITYGYVVNSIIKAILVSNTLRDEYRGQAIIMHTYMGKIKVSQKTEQQMQEYLQLLHLTQQNRDSLLEKQMKDKLPEQLKEELLKSSFSSFLVAIELVLGSTASHMLKHMQQRQYSSGELILRQGAEVNKIYYLHRGLIHLECCFHHSKVDIGTLKGRDQFIALYEFVMRRRASYSIHSGQGTVIYYIDKHHIEGDSKNHKEIYEYLKLTEYKVMYKKDYKIISYQCYFCNQPHPWQQCPTKFPQFAPTLQNQGRKHRERLVFNRYNALKNKKELNEGSDLVLRKIELRLLSLKQKLLIKKRNFTVDMAYEWKHYLPQQNLSSMRLAWQAAQSARKATLVRFILPNLA